MCAATQPSILEIGLETRVPVKQVDPVPDDHVLVVPLVIADVSIGSSSN